MHPDGKVVLFHIHCWFTCKRIQLHPSVLHVAFQLHIVSSLCAFVPCFCVCLCICVCVWLRQSHSNGKMPWDFRCTGKTDIILRFCTSRIALARNTEFRQNSLKRLGMHGSATHADNHAWFEALVAAYAGIWFRRDLYSNAHATMALCYA